MIKKMSKKEGGIALYLGKFQPFHNDHLKVVKKILKQHQKVKIAIGSSDDHHKKKNTFTYNGRKAMIIAALQEANISKRRYQIIAVPDICNDKKYVVYVKKCVGAFDMFYTGNQLNLRLFRKAGCRVKPIKRFSAISGTKIRKSIKEEKGYHQNMIPESVQKVLKKIDSEKRLQNISARKNKR